MTHAPEQWLDRYGDALYRYALLRVADAELAADLVQDTLLAALQARQDFRGEASEKTWLIAILKNKVADHLRRSGREVALDETAQVDEDPAEPHFDAAGRWRTHVKEWHSPERDLEQVQFWQTLADCLARLPRRMAQLFVLREVDGLEVEELCRTLNMPTANQVWVTLHRARLRLRACLQANWFGTGGK